MDCSICGNASGPDALCGTHKRLLATSPDLTPQQVRSRRPRSPTSLALIDMFGVAHPLAAEVLVGRDPDTCDVSILHASVSSRHAVLTVVRGVVTVTDQGSLNGTFVDDEQVTRCEIAERKALLRFGAVSFMLSPDAPERVAAPIGGRTVPRGPRSSRVAFAVGGARWELSILGEGATLSGAASEIALSLMEARLLHVLLARTGDANFLSTADLVSALGFGSRAADGDNVRELVRRLRRKLEPFGLGELIESRRHAGYRIFGQATLE